MSIQVSAVSSRRELKAFIAFQRALYRGSPYWVPPLIRDEMDTLTQIGRASCRERV
jgi:hypothetical protein